MCVWNANVCANVCEVQMCVQNALRFWDCMVYIGQFENKWHLYNTEPLIHEHGIYRLISPNILQFLCRFISHSFLDVSLGIMILLCNLFLNVCRWYIGLPWWLSGEESICQFWRPGFDPGVRKISWRRKWQPTPVFLPGKSHGQRSLVGYSLWGCKESDAIYWLNNNVIREGKFGGRNFLLHGIGLKWVEMYLCVII